ncbi:MAG TPA: hypothetical protein VLM84_11155 [Chromatiaceae bacterium]|nr:hypothetical protein [Chromatiaceae bacterium]
MTPVGSHRPFFSSSTLVPLVSVVLLLVVGIVVADDYGTSQDEYANYLVGADALQAYTSPGQFLDYIEGGDPLAHHGPSYFMLWAVTSKVWEEVVPWWTRADGRHFTNFLMYGVSVVGVYALSVRLVERRYAWMTAVLFATQPLLFGHAFINQKDTPFMGFFVLSVVVGLAVVDRLGRSLIEGEQAGGSWRGLREAWRRVRGVRKWLGVVTLGMMVLVVVDVLFTERLLWGLRWLAVRGAGGDVGQVGQMVVDLDEDAVRTAVEHAVLGVTWAYWAGRGLIVVGSVAIGALVLWWMMPAEMGRWWRRHGKEIGWVVLAGGLVGTTVSIRPIGGFAGVLVGAYWLYRLRARGGWLLGVYGAAALWVMYLTWPYLWDAPIARLMESM